MMKYFMILIPTFLFVLTGCDQRLSNIDNQAQRDYELEKQKMQDEHELRKFQEQEALRWKNAQIMKDKEIDARLKENEAAGKRSQKRLEENNRNEEAQQKERNAFLKPVLIILVIIGGFTGFYMYRVKKEEEGAVHKVRIKEEEETTRRKIAFVEKNLDKLSESERKAIFEGLKRPALA